MNATSRLARNVVRRLLPVVLSLACACSRGPAGTGDGRAGPASGRRPDRPSGPAGDGSSQLPEALLALAGDAGLEPFTRWSVPGVRLYSLSSWVPDESTTRVVGVEDGTGELVRGVELLRRGGAQPPEELARRVFGALLGQAFYEPLEAADERPQFASEQEWSLVRPPRMEGGALIFFSMQGDMEPELVEFRVDLATFALARRSARELLLERGEPVVVSGPLCIPRATCGCWEGCARVEQVELPGRDVAAVRLLDGPQAGRVLERRRECADGRCFAVCAADLPRAVCEDAYRFVDEACGESCPPSEAPYHCEAGPDGCVRVEHPGRVGATAVP